MTETIPGRRNPKFHTAAGKTSAFPTDCKTAAEKHRGRFSLRSDCQHWYVLNEDCSPQAAKMMLVPRSACASSRIPVTRPRSQIRHLSINIHSRSSSCHYYWLNLLICVCPSWNSMFVTVVSKKCYCLCSGRLYAISTLCNLIIASMKLSTKTVINFMFRTREFPFQIN